MKSLRFYIFLFCLLFVQGVYALSLSITSPKNGARFESCATLTIKAEFDIPETDVKRVYFYKNGQPLRSIRQAPWEYTWEDAPDGIYEIHAKLSTQDNQEVSTDSIQIFIGPVDDGDKIINGEFACGLPPWSLSVNAEAAAELLLVEDGWLSDEPNMAFVDIQNPGSANWHVMLVQNCPIDSGHTYHVYFTAEVEDSKSVGVDFQSTTGDYPVHFWQEVQVTSDEYFYGPVEFYCPVTDHSNQFKLALSTEASGIFLDAIKVIDLNWVKNETSVGRDITATKSFKLYQNYPNPFNPSTEIKFDLEDNTHVRLAVYNLAGQLVQTLVDEIRTAGTHGAVWNGVDRNGISVPSGIYIYQLATDNFTTAKRMLLIK